MQNMKNNNMRFNEILFNWKQGHYGEHEDIVKVMVTSSMYVRFLSSKSVSFPQ